MGFIKKIKEFATGKTEIERKREAQANKLIREKVLVAQLQEREKRAVEFARAREKFEYEKRLKAMKQPPKWFSGYESQMRSPIMGGVFSPQPPKPEIKLKKKKRTPSIDRLVYYAPQRRRRKVTQTQGPQKFQVI